MRKEGVIVTFIYYIKIKKLASVYIKIVVIEKILGALPQEH